MMCLFGLIDLDKTLVSPISFCRKVESNFVQVSNRQFVDDVCFLKRRLSASPHLDSWGFRSFMALLLFIGFLIAMLSWSILQHMSAVDLILNEEQTDSVKKTVFQRRHVTMRRHPASAAAVLEPIPASMGSIIMSYSRKRMISRLLQLKLSHPPKRQNSPKKLTNPVRNRTLI